MLSPLKNQTQHENSGQKYPKIGIITPKNSLAGEMITRNNRTWNFPPLKIAYIIILQKWPIGNIVPSKISQHERAAPGKISPNMKTVRVKNRPTWKQRQERISKTSLRAKLISLLGSFCFLCDGAAKSGVAFLFFSVLPRLISSWGITKCTREMERVRSFLLSCS